MHFLGRGDHHNIIYLGFLKYNEALNAHLYIHQLQRIQKHCVEKHPTLFNKTNAVRLHDAVRSHTERTTREKIMELGWSILPDPSYSPDLA